MRPFRSSSLALALVLGLVLVPAWARAQQPRTCRGNPALLLPPRPGRLVIGVMGSADAESTIAPELRTRLERLGSSIASRGHVVLTGACPGMPLVVARSAKQAGGFAVGISPAGSLKDHTGRFHAPTEAMDVIQMTNAGPGMGFIAREKQNIQYSDILVFAGGRSGTLGELLFAMQERKVIALLEDSTGVSEKAKQQILPHIGRGRAVFVSDKDPERLMRKAVAAHEHLQERIAGCDARKESRTLAKLWSGTGETHGADQRRARRQPAMYRTEVVTPRLFEQHTVFNFMGSTRGMSAGDKAKVMSLVDLMAQDQTGGRTPLLVTSTRAGLSASVARAAQRRGVQTVGMSSASTPLEHRTGRQPLRGFGAIQLTGEGAGVGELAAYRHGLERADVVFVAGGDHQTLGGTIFAMYQPTVVAVLETGGMSGKLRSEILSTFHKPAHAEMIYDTDPVRLYQKAVRAAEKLRHAARTQYIAPE